MPVPWSGPWPAPSVPKVDAGATGDAGDADLAEHYETLRRIALRDGPGRAGLGAALLLSKGMAAWMRGWRACTPAPPGHCQPTGAGPPCEIVGVLAAMALACSEGT